jgi:CBS domain containing-hemolysin-like protein
MRAFPPASFPHPVPTGTLRSRPRNKRIQQDGVKNERGLVDNTLSIRQVKAESIMTPSYFGRSVVRWQ